jgi:glyoxylase-like metal-dependent hydrolase (beta-lactamase superfamily II)
MLDDVRVLSAGYCTHPEAMTRRGASWRPCRFPGGFALLVHRKHGAVLYDTGYSEAFYIETRAMPEALYGRVTPVHVNPVETARAQLARDGIDSSDVRFVVVSHFHADHIAGLRDFPAARVACSRAAWDSVRTMRGFGALLKGFLPGLIPYDIEERLTFVDDLPPAPLPPPIDALGAGRDLFGDGSIVVVDLPGHAPGHIGVLVQSPRGPVLLAGDAAWSRAAIETDTPPPRITTAFLGNTHAYRTTLARLGALHRAMPELRIVPSHAIDAAESGG